MKQYLNLLADLRKNGVKRTNRTATATYGLFGKQLRYDLAAGFPLLTTKRVHVKSIVHELLWFLRGETNLAYLHEHGVTIWDEWADAAGELGPIYGAQWRRWQDAAGTEHDQISEFIRLIREQPDSRRIILSSWNVGELSKMKLSPCHVLCQAYVQDGRLSLQLYQRSADYFLGVPFNLASYALLTHMLAQVTSLQVGDFIHTFGDVHLYENHLDQVDRQLEREPRALSTLRLNPAIKNIFAFKFGDISFEDYDPHPAISAPVAV